MAQSHDSPSKTPSALTRVQQWWLLQGLNPPHIMAWRLLWAGPGFLGMGLTYLALLLGWGPGEAKAFWRRNR